MNSKQRVLAAAGCEQPDRIPIDFWAVGEVFDRLADELGVADTEGVLRKFDVDVRYFRGPGAANYASETADETFEDQWGVRRQWHCVTGQRKDGRPYTWRYKHLVHSPLAEAQGIADIEKHPWPDPQQWDYSGVKAACEAIVDMGRAVIFGGDRLDRTAQLKAAMYLRGMEQFMADLALEPAMAECLLEHITAYYLEYNRLVFEAAAGGIDIFFMGDDMGTQNSTWVSIDMYKRFFKERFSRFNELAHSFDAKTMCHTCGRVTDIVGEFVDAGLDILQSLQPSAMGQDFGQLKSRFGGHLCFQGGIDIQKILPHGSVADVRRHVQRVAKTIGAGGGYIFGTAHNILPDVPTENILALIDAYHEFGPYA
ncbi:MAG: uroporphyrinogen decarboxylase family protein [Phycisphaerae bacterium]|nr:uroporphyrinogen decarboxylase family protein [Phycisphaerae bacterium]